MFATAVAGRCVSFVSKTKLNYAFNFEFIPTQPVSTTYLTAILQNMSASFRHKFGFKRCTVCEVATNFNVSQIGYGGQEKVMLYIRFVFSTSFTCEWAYLQSRAQWLYQTENSSLLLGNVTFKIRYYTSPQEFSSKVRQLGVMDTPRKCPFYYPGGFSCPWTTLSSIEMEELRNQTGNSFTYLTRTNKNGDFELCIDAYKNILRGIKSDSVQNKYTGFMILPVLVMAILKDTL